MDQVQTRWVNWQYRMFSHLLTTPHGAFSFQPAIADTYTMIKESFFGDDPAATWDRLVCM